MTSSSQAVTQGMTSNTQAVTQGMTSMSQAVTQGVNQIKQAFTQGMNQVKQSATQGFNSVRQTAQSGMNSTVSAVTNAMSRVTSAVRNAMTQAVSAMNSAAGQARSAGYNMGAGFLGGLNAMSGAIIGRARAIASAAAAAMRSALRIHSPSRVTAQIGEYTGEGFVDGIDNLIRPAKQMATKLANGAVDALDKIQSNRGFNLGISDMKAAPSSVTAQVTHALSGDSQIRPIDIQLNMGGKVYRAFATDIQREQDLALQLERY